ncbi:MAG: HsdR family type I site-specific deoxyribonuclease [Sphaerochaetaceae bacterium]|nr:HsdR family type I site-specific deoxyribonuclease [Sphaerochaetaceae bacterium]
MDNIFDNEAKFEESLINSLTQTKGWESSIIKYPTEEDLINNWAQILYDNNRGIDRLNDYPLTKTEMDQIIEQIIELKTPLKLNGFINGKTVSIKRDNPQDKLHYGKEISLKIYDRREIAAGQSRYQIVQQPIFKNKSKMLNDRRGDIMLLINGMPVIHIELKKSGVSIVNACNQIKKYSHEGVYTGIYSLVQIFVAMTPSETLYFANPGSPTGFNPSYYFHWADFNNEPINDWKDIASTLLSIPMAHKLIGFYTVADDSDGILKVMRSYQYYAANAISDNVSKNHWDEHNQRGGYIWHTTGSGKTMTSFKSAQLISNSQDADKVVFLMDRIELGTQSLNEYRAFSDENEDIQSTENTNVLVTKLKSSEPKDTLIVTSIQKMSNIKNEDNYVNTYDIELINSKRIVFIVDEAHRSTFGDMMNIIKETFPNALFFGFTGTPIQAEHLKKDNTTASIFGNELHRYSIADGIRDKNVLGFDPWKILTFKDKDLRTKIALEQAHAISEDEAISNPEKSKIYYKFMDSSRIKMASYKDKNGIKVKGIEDYIPLAQYKTKTHKSMVVKDIKENWKTLSHANKYHAIFATSSIPEAIEYYSLIKEEIPNLKITALFDSNIDNNEGAIFKEEGLVKILEDYNREYDQNYTIKNHKDFKTDVSARLAHKAPYNLIEKNRAKQLDLLIVVDQMLTGFDSKWINTLYLDKVLEYEYIIQAFSRTNRINDHEKPFGIIRYYRKPHTMEENIKKAIELYSGNKPLGLFVQKLDKNLKEMNDNYNEIKDLFKQANINNFDKLPEDSAEKSKFISLLNKFNSKLEAAKIQGFTWSQKEYKKEPKGKIKVDIDKKTYLTLVQRYKEIATKVDKTNDTSDISYEIEGYLTEIDTEAINDNYLNSRFTKYLKALKDGSVDDAQIQKTLDDLHKSFASLSQENQKYANIFLHDVQRGEAKFEEGKKFIDYVIEYKYRAKHKQVLYCSQYLGLNEDYLSNFMNSAVSESNINEFGRFDELKKQVDINKAKDFFEKSEKKTILPFEVKMKVHKFLQDFILQGGFDIEQEDEN